MSGGNLFCTWEGLESPRAPGWTVGGRIMAHEMSTSESLGPVNTFYYTAEEK